MTATECVAWRKVSPFQVFLRTGRHIAETSSVGPWSVKFNPWHDPRDGRFTFGPGEAGTGRTMNASPKPDNPFVGRGGSFGGGGASGSWQPDNPSASKPNSAHRGLAPAVATQASGSTRTISRNGCRFSIDAEGRTREVSGPLALDQSGSRSRSAQARAGGSDRLTSDDGGHYIAARFNGPRDAFNHFAQDRNFNRGGYRALEVQWAREVRSGHSVKVDIVPSYSGRSHRPSKLRVSWSIGRMHSVRNFLNRPGGG